MRYARLRRHYYVRVLVEMIMEHTSTEKEYSTHIDASRPLHVVAYHVYMFLERRFDSQICPMVAYVTSGKSKRARVTSDIFKACDPDNAVTTAAKLDFADAIGGEQAVISVYEWHAEATSYDVNVTTELKKQIDIFCGMTDEMKKETRSRRMKEKTEERCLKLMAALDKKGVPAERKQLQALFMQQVEDDSGGVGALLRLVHDKVAAASKLKSKASEQKGNERFSFFDKGDDGVHDPHRHGLIDVNAVSKNGTTPLMLAALGGDVIAVKHLLAAGADVTKKSKTKPHTTIDFFADKHLMRDGKLVIDGAGIAALKNDTPFGESQLELILMLASATVVAVEKADALKEKQVEAEALSNGDWLDDDDDVSSKMKAAKGSGGGGGGKKKRKAKKKKQATNLQKQKSQVPLTHRRHRHRLQKLQHRQRRRR
jgi:hypothetical protein